MSPRSTLNYTCLALLSLAGLHTASASEGTQVDNKSKEALFQWRRFKPNDRHLNDSAVAQGRLQAGAALRSTNADVMNAEAIMERKLVRERLLQVSLSYGYDDEDKPGEPLVPPTPGPPTPGEPAPTPEEPAPTPGEPAPTPAEPAPTPEDPEDPAPTPEEPAPTPEEPAPTPEEPAPTNHRTRHHIRGPDEGQIAAADASSLEVAVGGSFMNQQVMLMGGTLQQFLAGLEESGEIGERQSTTILTTLLRGQDLTMTMHRIKGLPAEKQQELRSYLLGQTDVGLMSEDTAEYIATLLNLELHPQPSVGSVARPPAPAFYTGNGNVRQLGSNLNVDPPGSGELYNGIWGHATASREYALQCNSNGLHIIDVTDAATSGIYRVQNIFMAGGTIWRDVQTHFHASSGKTYAYVAAQSNGNFWVIDLSALSSGEPHEPDSNPISFSDYVDRGRTNYGHTLFLFNGLLFLNRANSGSCQIFDIDVDPWNPPLLTSTGVRDCHDSTGKVSIDVPGEGLRDLLISAGGYERRHHVLDVTDVRNSGNPVTKLGETVAFPNTYAHSGTLTEDNRYLYAFEEFDLNDISVYDLSDVETNSIPLVTHFKWSGDGTESAHVHNGHVRGNYLHVAYYEAGYRVFDISNPNQAVEVGKYETWRDPDGDGNLQRSINGDYDGAWNLAFLPSGKVILSDTSSGTFVFETDPVVLPGKPLSLQAVPAGSGGQVDLSWTEPATGTAAGYTIYRGISTGAHGTVVATNVVGTSFTDTTLTLSRTYYYVVTATNAEGESVASDEASVTINVPCSTDQDCELGLQCNAGACSTAFPSLSPSQSALPSAVPSHLPTFSPSQEPSNLPTSIPSRLPSGVPTKSVFPSSGPSNVPSSSPSSNPSESFAPTSFEHPSSSPSKSPSPSSQPSQDPTRDPTKQPSAPPSDTASTTPTQAPSKHPSVEPSSTSSFSPSSSPSSWPSPHPTAPPSSDPSSMPSAAPSFSPSSVPSGVPSSGPSPQPQLWSTIFENDFENSWGDFVDGGGDADRRSDGTQWANSGAYALRIRDNTATSVITAPINGAENYSEFRVSFFFNPRNMNANEDFWLQTSVCGGSWTTIEAWTRGSEWFSNGQWYQVSDTPGADFPAVVFSNSQGCSNVQFRFRCDASANNDRVYIDDVLLEGKQ